MTQVINILTALRLSSGMRFANIAIECQNFLILTSETRKRLDDLYPGSAKPNEKFPG